MLHKEFRRHVVLGGTDTFTVDFNGDRLLSYAVGANSSGGKVTNTGKISAPGGRIEPGSREAGNSKQPRRKAGDW